MNASNHIHPDTIRTMFSSAMSDMYRNEVPQYGTLLELVAQVNADCLGDDPVLRAGLEQNGELDRLDVERHGAIRLGTADELFTMRRLFAVMGMYPVGYYDLSVAGVPVHSTAFRPVDDAALRRNPFRVFTSLLRLELIEDAALRDEAAAILARRRIYTDLALALIAKAEENGGLGENDAAVFVTEALETFRWHSDATVSIETYRKLHDAHRLIADVVCFKGPHINHLTPRTLDIDRVQRGMPERGIAPKAVVEGPPTRKCPILLRQTSFKALEEKVHFGSSDGDRAAGTHTARFGEIEQRGIALTPKGRKLYDDLLASVRDTVKLKADGSNAAQYDAALIAAFADFPDDYETLRRQDLGYFQFSATAAGLEAARLGEGSQMAAGSVDDLIAAGYLRADPIVYEDFLPVSAAGIFQSNLGNEAQKDYREHSNQDVFEAALGAAVADELAHYAERQDASLLAARALLQQQKTVA